MSERKRESPEGVFVRVWTPRGLEGSLFFPFANLSEWPGVRGRRREIPFLLRLPVLGTTSTLLLA